MLAMWGNVSKEKVVLHEDGRTRKIVDQDCVSFFQNLYIILV
jgi:ribosome-associated protein YbcJ (S4-like RNA binding protein)